MLTLKFKEEEWGRIRLDDIPVHDDVIYFQVNRVHPRRVSLAFEMPSVFRLDRLAVSPVHLGLIMPKRMRL